MPRAHTWRDLTVGITTLGAVIGAAALILTFARVGALHGRKLRLYAATTDATGVLPGTEVWLAGQKVGRVDAVGFRPPSADTALRVLLTLEVLAHYQQQIRRNAAVSVRPGLSLIGAPVVSVEAVRATAPVVTDGDTLFADPNAQFQTLRARVTEAAGTELPVILDNFRLLALQLRTAQGTLGAIGVSGADRLEATAHLFGTLANQAAAAGRTFGAARAGTLPARARDILTRVDAVRARLDGPRNTIGRYRTDSTLLRSVDSLRTDLAEVERLLATPTGTIGRARFDHAIQLEIARAHAELDALSADVRRNPLRYVGF